MRLIHSCLMVISLALSAGTPAGSSAETGSWRPFNLGSHHRTVSTKEPGAQKAFDQGLMWAFAFNHDEAVRAFQEAVRLDPLLAMGWWGIALVNGPHINNPTLDDTHAKVAWDALAEARRLGSNHPVERDLIAALEHRYAMPNPADRKPLDEGYAKAMGDLAARFPKDADLAALYAEALMDVRPWDQWTRTGDPQQGTQEILAALKRSLKLAPNHPLALHLTIHATEASPHPEWGKAAADRLRRLAPDAGHLVHMPGHTYARIGDWRGAARSNEQALEADARYKLRQPDIGFYGLYMVHDADFLAYTALMEGRKEVALIQAKAVVNSFPIDWVVQNLVFADAFQTRYWEALKRFGLWEELLAEPAPDARLPVSTAYWHALRGTAFAASGKVAEALKEQADFEAAQAKVLETFTWGSNGASSVLLVAKSYLAGEIAYSQGNVDDAVGRLQEAVKLEDALKYDEPPACVIPARHALGAVLLAAGRAKEAEAVYRTDQKAYPANYWSLLGLERALSVQGLKAEAAKVTERMKQAQRRADVRPETSCACVKPGA